MIVLAGWDTIFGAFAPLPSRPSPAVHVEFFTLLDFAGWSCNLLAFLTWRPSFCHLLDASLFFRDRKNQRSHRFDAVDADQGSAGPLDPPHGIVAGPSLCALSAPPHRRRGGAQRASPCPLQRRTVVLLHLHNLHAGGCRPGPPMTGRRPRYISIIFTMASGSPGASPFPLHCCFHAVLRYHLRFGRVTDPPLQR